MQLWSASRRPIPENAGWQRDLSVSDNKVGDVLVAQGNLPEAMKSYRDLPRSVETDPKRAFGHSLSCKDEKPHLDALRRIARGLKSRATDCQPLVGGDD